MAGPRKRVRATVSDQASLLQVTGQAFWERFPRPWAGLDEAGRGCLAGPVIAAAVILPENCELKGLNDSKAMTPESRDELEPLIKRHALAWGIGASWPREIERVNILQASLLAMCRAVRSLRTAPVFLAVDGNHSLPLNLDQKTVVGGDGLVPSIAAASVLAKTFRDKLLAILDRRYPDYGFAKHKGYATQDHYQALERFGPCRYHRLTFRGVAPAHDAVTVQQGEQLWLPKR